MKKLLLSCITLLVIGGCGCGSNRPQTRDDRLFKDLQKAEEEEQARLDRRADEAERQWNAYLRTLNPEQRRAAQAEYRKALLKASREMQ